MKTKHDASIFKNFLNPRRIFWILVFVGVVFTAIGILLGNPFEDYQAAATL